MDQSSFLLISPPCICTRLTLKSLPLAWSTPRTLNSSVPLPTEHLHLDMQYITTNCGIFFKRWGIPDHPTYLLRNLYAGQEATVRTRHGKRDWFQIGKGVHQGCRLSPCLFNLQSTSGEMLGWIKHKLESRLPGEILITSDMQMTLPLWKKVKRN